eukprot:SAG31_NODE_542_length_14269_cov_7.826253_2_plen_254_part_00
MDGADAAGRQRRAAEPPPRAARYVRPARAAGAGLFQQDVLHEVSSAGRTRACSAIWSAMIATLRLRNIGSHVCAAASPRPGAVSRSFCGRVAETPPSQAELALIVGAGPGISAACARLFRKEGMEVAIAARSISKPAVASLVAKHGCHAFHCDAADPGSVDSLFSAIATKFGRPPALVVYNPSGRAKGPVETLDPAAVRDALLVSAFGAFLVAQAAAKVMLPVGRGPKLPNSGLSTSHLTVELETPLSLQLTV